MKVNVEDLEVYQRTASRWRWRIWRCSGERPPDAGGGAIGVAKNGTKLWVEVLKV